MNSKLESQIHDFGLGKHLKFLTRVSRPCLNIIRSKAAITEGCSKLGGAPDLPRAFAWPSHKFGLYRFIGQFDLSKIPKGLCGLPSSGLLSFFYAYDEKGESFYQHLNYVRVYYFNRLAPLESKEPPASVRFGPTFRVKLEAGVSLPDASCFESSGKDWPINDSESEAYWELRLELHLSGWYLGGYPFNNRLAYDPTPGPEWRSLLTLSSDDALYWSWNDGSSLVTFIEEQRLSVADFSHIKADAG